MIKYLWNISNDEVLEKWKNNEIIWSIELGGIGPNYELAIQRALFDIFDYLNSNNISPESLIENKRVNKKFENICDEILKDRDLTGAMYYAARNTAFQFHKYGYAYMMNKSPEDRRIQINKD